MTKYEELKDFINHATTNDLLTAADIRLVDNFDVLTLDEYRDLRYLLEDAQMQHGTFRVIVRSGSVKHEMWTEMTYEDALNFCEKNHWIYDYNGGLWWDLEIEEEF